VASGTSGGEQEITASAIIAAIAAILKNVFIFISFSIKI